MSISSSDKDSVTTHSFHSIYKLLAKRPAVKNEGSVKCEFKNLITK